MMKMTGARNATAGPRKRQKRFPYNHNVDEPAKLIDEENADVERDVPAKTNEPVEGRDDLDGSGSPAFEE